jgi:hypothetical protein
MRIARVVRFLALACAALGCGDDLGGTGRGVCPTCIERAGGETGDFGGQCGPLKSEPVTAEVERDFGLAELRSALQAPQTLGARWSSDEGSKLPIEDTTSIEFEVGLGAFEYLTHPDCGDYVVSDVSVRYRVGTDTLSGTATGVLWMARGDPPAQLYANGDLAHADGTLDIDAGTDRRHAGQVEISARVFPSGLRGELIPELIYFENDDQADLWRAGSPTVFGDLRVLYELRFPLDDCPDDVEYECLGSKTDL